MPELIVKRPAFDALLKKARSAWMTTTFSAIGLKFVIEHAVVRELDVTAAALVEKHGVDAVLRALGGEYVRSEAVLDPATNQWVDDCEFYKFPPIPEDA